MIRPFLEHDSESIEVTLSRNLRTTINCSRSVLPVMRSQGYGRIVNIGADSVRSGLYAHAIYNAAKGGVSGMAVGLARECAPDGITVNVVAPGGIAGVHTRPAEETHLEKASAQALELIPMRRLGEIAEVAHAVVFLASPEASYITGQVLAVNGGCTMG